MKIKERVFRWFYKRLFDAIDREWERLQSVSNGLNEDAEQQFRHGQSLRDRELHLAKKWNIVELAQALVSNEQNVKRAEICLQKVHYGTEEAAEYAALSIHHSSQGKNVVKPYHCLCCGKWALTHTDNPTPFLKRELVCKEVSNRMKSSIGDLLAMKGQ